MNRDDFQEILSALREDATAADIAAAVSPYGAVYALADSERGDVALIGGGGLAAPRWGKGVRKGDAHGARALFAQTGDDANIGVRIGDAEYVIDVQARKVRSPRQTVSASVRPATNSRPRKSQGERGSPKPPEPPSVAKAKATLRNVGARERALETQVRESEKSLADLRKGAQRAEESAARRKERIGRSFVDALREGRDPPDFAEDREKVLRDEMEASARRTLIPELEEQVRQAKRALAEHKRDLADAALDLDASLTEDAATQTAKALKQLLEPLAALEAVSLVRGRLLGNSFTFDPRRHRAPLGTEEIVSGLLAGIPPSLASSLSCDAIHRRAHKIAAEVLEGTQPKNDGE